MQTRPPVALYVNVGTEHPPLATHTCHPPPTHRPSPPSPQWISQTWQILGLQGQEAARKQQDRELQTARQRRSLIDSCKALGVRQKLVKNSCCWVLMDNVFILTAETLQTVMGLRSSPSLAHTWTHTQTTESHLTDGSAVLSHTSLKRQHPTLDERAEKAAPNNHLFFQRRWAQQDIETSGIVSLIIGMKVLCCS